MHCDQVLLLLGAVSISVRRAGQPGTGATMPLERSTPHAARSALCTAHGVPGRDLHTRTGRWVFFGRPFIQKVRIAVRSVHAFAHRHASRSLAWLVHAGGDESVCWQRV